MEYDVVSFEQSAPRLDGNREYYYDSPVMSITLMSKKGIEIKINLLEHLRDSDKIEITNVFYKAYKDRVPVKIAFGIVGEELNKMVESPKINK